jgi:hypothetical protein
VSDRESREVVLVLSEAGLPEGEMRSQALEELIEAVSDAGVREIHVLEVSEFKTSTFIWPLMLELRLPDEFTDSAATDSLRRALERCECLAHGRPRFLRYRQTGFGGEHDGADLIVSFYSWQKATSPDAREREMWIHFDMEREEQDYTAVHFNVSPSVQVDEEGFDFAFQAYVDDPEGVSRIFSSERLEIMRDHSKTFLNTDTRRLGFGKVQILPVP